METKLKKLSLKKDVITKLEKRQMKDVMGAVGKSVENPGYCGNSINTDFTQIMTCCDTLSICNTNCNC